MTIFSVQDSGLIQIGRLPRGDMTVMHTGSGLVFEVVRASCNKERGYWNPDHKNWIIFSQFAEQVLAEFDEAATRIYS